MATTLRRDEFLRLLARQRPSGVYAFCGPEALLRQEALDAMQKALSRGEEGSGARYAIDALRVGECEPSAILAAASQTGLFGGERLVWVEGLERIGRVGKQERAVWDAIVGAAHPNPVVLVSALTSRELLRRSATLAALLKSVTVVEFWQLFPRDAQRWLIARAKQYQLRISTGVAERLVAHHGMDLLALSQEVEKLSLLHGPGDLNEGDLQALTRGGLLGSAWECVQAVMGMQVRGALEGLSVVRSQESAFSFAWKLSQSALQRLAESAGGRAGAGPRAASDAGAHALNAREKNLLGRLVTGCYDWERRLKGGAWLSAHDFSALEGLIVAHSIGSPGEQRTAPMRRA